MRNFFIFFILFFSCSLAASSEEPQASLSKKTYVQPNQISISEKGIFILLENLWFAVEAIHIDTAGIYAHIDSSYFSWKCRYCGHENPWWVNECEACHRR